MTAAHHSSANGQAERTVQTFLLSLIAILGAKLDPSDWEDYVPHVVLSLNTSVSATTKQIPYSMLYGRDPKTFLPTLDNPSESFAQRQQDIREEAAGAIQIAKARMKIYYDDRHRKPPELQAGDYVFVKLAKPGKRGYHLNNQTKLSFPRVGPFKILERLSSLHFRIDLPKWLT